ncbi:hypothetical protein Agub_g15392, partial [Astrephomene gubernaculifera]
PPSPTPPSPQPPSPPPPPVCPFNTTPVGLYITTCSGCTFVDSRCVLECAACSRIDGTAVASSLSLVTCRPGWSLYSRDDGQLDCSAFADDLGPITWVYQSGTGRHVMWPSREPRVILTAPVAVHAENPQQIWHIRTIDQANAISIIHPAANASLCWDVAWSSQDDGAKVVLYPCYESGLQANRKFKIVQSCVPGEVHIIAMHSGKCLGTNLANDDFAQYTCHYGPSQRFRIQGSAQPGSPTAPVLNPTFAIAPAVQPQCSPLPPSLPPPSPPLPP